MPLLRITCPAEHTEGVVRALEVNGAGEVSLIPQVSRTSGGDLIIAEVPRGAIDALLAGLPPSASAPGLHVAIAQSEELVPEPGRDRDDDAVIWAQVVRDVHDAGRLSAANVLLVVAAAMIAAIGIIEGQLLLIVGAMALSPDYFPIVDTCLSLSRGAWGRALEGLRTLAASFAAASAGAWLLTEVLVAANVVGTEVEANRQLTLFISQPDVLSVVVALLAGVAGALAITLPGTRGLVGVFVSVTTIPAAANIGVAIAGRDPGELGGAAVQLLVNVASLLVSGTVTLAIRRRIAPRLPRPGGA